MKLIKLTTAVFLLGALFWSCSSGSVLSDHDRFTDFNDYKTFDFYAPGSKLSSLSEADKASVLSATEQHLAEQGYTRSTNPDLLVSIFTSSGERSHTYNNSGWGWDWGWGWGPWWAGNFPPGAPNPAEGTLFIDLIDCKTKTLVWQGIATENLYAKGDELQGDQGIARIAQEVLGVFPPPNKKKQLAQN